MRFGPLQPARGDRSAGAGQSTPAGRGAVGLHDQEPEPATLRTNYSREINNEGDGQKPHIERDA
jgi:hypothetical protein